jgi:hypothetical protein
MPGCQCRWLIESEGGESESENGDFVLLVLFRSGVVSKA